jgi:hypothetical protein
MLFHWCFVRLSHASISSCVCFEGVIYVCLCTVRLRRRLERLDRLLIVSFEMVKRGFGAEQ